MMKERAGRMGGQGGTGRGEGRTQYLAAVARSLFLRSNSSLCQGREMEVSRTGFSVEAGVIQACSVSH